MRISDWSSDVCSSDLEDRYQSQRPYYAYKAKMWRGTFAWTFVPNDNVEFKWRNFAHRAERTFFFGQNFSKGVDWADPAYPSTDVSDSPRIFNVWGTEPRLTVRHGIQTITVGARYVHESVDRSEEHTSELQSLMRIPYAVFCLKKK